MRFSFVLLLCFLVGCALGAPNYVGCFAGFSVNMFDSNPDRYDFGISAGDPFPSNPVGACQAYCVSQGSTTVALGEQRQSGGAGADVKVCYCDPPTTATASTCTELCPGASPAQGTHCGGPDSDNNGNLGSVSVYVIDCNIGSSVCDDPHFTGLDRSRYNYIANPNRVVALISDRAVQVNSLFIQKGNNSNTYMGQVGIRVCNRTMRFFPNGTVVLGEGAGVLDSKIYANAMLSDAFTVTRLMPTTVRVHAGSWRMTIDMKYGWMINIFGISHLDSNDTNVHGAFGITGHPDHHQRKKELCQPGNEGGCELPGKWQDYELPVGADLCSTEWTYKQFNTIQCPLIVQHAVEVQKLEDKRRGVSN